MKQWDYIIEEMKPSEMDRVFEFGNNGWELVTVVLIDSETTDPILRHYFKKERF